MPIKSFVNSIQAEKICCKLKIYKNYSISSGAKITYAPLPQEEPWPSRSCDGTCARLLAIQDFSE